MSVVLAPLPAHTSPAELPQPRKRTSSFSYHPLPVPDPRPAKAARKMGAPLRRQETLIIAPSPSAQKPESVLEPEATTSLPYYRTLQYYKDQRLKRKAVLKSNGEPMTISTSPPRPAPVARAPQAQPHSPQPFQPLPLSAAKPTAPLRQRRSPASSLSTSTTSSSTSSSRRSAPALRAPSQVILPSIASPVVVRLTPRTSSPLAPNQTTRPGRPIFPRSKQEPDLYRLALRSCMAATVEGKKMALMGTRIAYTIETATRELERIVADQEDVVMAEADACDVALMAGATSSTPHSSSLAKPVLTASWVMVKGEDWEMVDCAA